MFKMKFRKISLSTIISLLALLLAGISTFRSCSNEEEIEKNNYEIKSLEYRPKLKLSEPKILSIELESDSIKSQDSTDTVGLFYSKLHLKLQIKITNIGNNNGKIVGYVIADTISKERILKDFIVDKSRYDNNSTNSLKLPYLYKELNPIDSFNVELDYTPQFILSNKFIIHILLLYENDIGQLFDTYYWLEYNTNDIIIPNPALYSDNKLMLNSISKSIFSSIKFIDENNFSSIYSENEKNEILKLNDSSKTNNCVTQNNKSSKMENLYNSIINDPKLLIAIIATLTSIISIIIGFVGLRIQRKHNKKSVLPIGVISLADYEDVLSISISNSGVGPMIINSCTTKGKTESKKYPIDWMPNDILWASFMKGLENHAIIPGKSITILKLKIDLTNKKGIETRDNIRRILKDLEIIIEYSDIYKKEFKTSRKLDWFGRNL